LCPIILSYVVRTGTIDGSGDWWWHNQRNRTAVPSGRPNLIQLVNVKGIEVSGVTLQDSPFWCLHPVQSEDIHVHHIKIRSRMYAPNSDGVDPDSSKNVMIEYVRGLTVRCRRSLSCPCTGAR